MQFVEWVLEVWKEHLGKSSIFLKVLFYWMIVGIGLIMFLNSNYYAENWKVPGWKFEMTKQGEVLIPDIELRGGYIVVCPQINVKYNDEIIYIINVKNYYNQNYNNLTYALKEHENIRGFILPIEEEQKIKENKFEEDFAYLLERKLSSDGIKNNDNIRIDFSRLAFVTYQNKKANQSREMYIYLSDKNVRQILREEVGLRYSSNEIDLDLFDTEQSKYMNEELLKQVEQCTEQLYKIMDKERNNGGFD